MFSALLVRLTREVCKSVTAMPQILLLAAAFKHGQAGPKIFSKSCPVPLVSASPKSQCPAPPEISVDSKQLSPFPLLIHHIHLNAADMCLNFGMTILDVEVCCTLLLNALNQYCSPADCLLSEHYVPSA